MNKLLEQLRTLPEFNKFETAIKEKLNENCSYVQEFMPESGEFIDYDEGRKYGDYRKSVISENDALEEGIDGLLSENETYGYFCDFVVEELGADAFDLLKALIRELRK